ncbi:MAG: hypothetical protein M3Q81_02475 [bacterium]|nr:hypothetical protein [bacterium]
MRRIDSVKRLYHDVRQLFDPGFVTIKYLHDEPYGCASVWWVESTNPPVVQTFRTSDHFARAAVSGIVFLAIVIGLFAFGIGLLIDGYLDKKLR